MRLLLAMLLAVLLAACAPVRPPANDGAGPAPAATLRIAVPAARAVSGWRTGAWAERLNEGARMVALLREDGDGRLRAAFATGWTARSGPDGAPCWVFRLREPRAAEIVEDWSVRLATRDRGLLDLLAGVRGIGSGNAGDPPDGLRADGHRLWVCTAVEDPMVPRRLAHPAAWPRVGGGSGPGLVAVEIEDPTADARALFGTGVADGVIGEGAATRIESWDPVWALWLNPTARWTADPTFRAWLARSIDREDLAAEAIGEGGVSSRVLIADSDPPEPEEPGVRPFSDGSRPRIDLGFDRRDRFARALCSRLKARLAEAGVDLDLEPYDELPFDAFSRERSPAAVLFLYRPSTTDPSLALLETLSGLGAAGAPFAETLRARPFETGEPREIRARAVQWELLRSARLVPLVRAGAVVVGDLRGFTPVPGGHLVPPVSGGGR
jgi:hypothetical protein